MNRRGQVNRQAQRRVSFAPERSPPVLVGGGASKQYVLGIICVATLFALDLAPAWAQSSAWVGGSRPPPPAPQTSYNWRSSCNWITPSDATPPSCGVPGGNALGNTATAIFNGATPTFISTYAGANIGTLQFNAPNFVFNAQDGLTINDSGIVASAANAPTFNVIGPSTGSPGTTPTMIFNRASSAGTANIVADTGGSILFNDQSNAGNAQITIGAGGSVRFLTEATGGNASFTNNGIMDISGLGPTMQGMTAGSIAGAGTFNLGSKQLTVGFNGLSTTVSGLIEDGGKAGGVGGSLVKVGTGTLTLSGVNTYTGGTTVSDGTLLLSSVGTLGSATGSTTITGGALDLGGTTQTQALVNLSSGTLENGTLNAPISSTGGTINGINGVASLTTTAGTTTIEGINAYTGATIINGGTLHAGGVNVFSPNSHTVVTSGGTLDLYGFNQTLRHDLENQGTVNFGIPGMTPPGTTLTVFGSYLGAGGTLNLNTFLGPDGSASDRLILSGSPVSGPSFIHITNVDGPGAETTANGILVVQALGSTQTAGAFTLANGELRAGDFDYLLFQGGVGHSDPNDWFLRSSFISGGGGGGGGGGGEGGGGGGGGGGGEGGGGGGGGGGGSLPDRPPPNPLPPGVAFPIIGPELATYGVVQPLARQLGVSILGTLDDRVGDTYEPDVYPVQPEASPAELPTKKPGPGAGALPTKKPGPTLAPRPLFAPSVWGRFFGQTVDNHYQAFADPRASGNLGGFQGGIDLLRGSLIAGHTERAGLYGAFGDTDVNVDGLVTNPAATAYINTHTGSVHLDAWSGGAYWTHIGPAGWYLDAVLQGTRYGGSASTQFARLDTNGWGLIASLEGGYPFAWPQFGPGFVIEPQAQILWQKVSFEQRNDGLGEVAVGDTTGPSGRIGLRTKWTIVTEGGQVWQPYLRANLWEDWGANANTVFSGTDSVPLANQATMLEFGGGLTGRLNANVSVFANVDYQFAVGGNSEKRNGVRGAFGARYTW
jgi:outer membrane autotransporter protein